MASSRVTILDMHVARAVAAMKSDPKRRWTVASLGRIAGLSRAALARRFTTTLGISPYRWLATHRLRLAEEQLASTDAPLALIAQDVGYGCEFAFAKAFKRFYGIAPGAFRRRVRARTHIAPVACASFRAAA